MLILKLQFSTLLNMQILYCFLNKLVFKTFILSLNKLTLI